MATTSNYGWTTPDDSSLVKDGASAIRALGTAIDTSMNTALGTKKAGMVLLNTTSFSAQTSVSVNSIFTSTYDNYYVEIDFTQGSTNDISLKLRASGTDKSTNYVSTGTTLNGSTVGSYGTGTTTFMYLLQATNGVNFCTINFTRPAISGPTVILASSSRSTDAIRYVNSSGQTETTTFDGFTFISGASTTGKIKVFGVNQ